ncbi:hypothetical protein HBA54_25615 [Pelagibius litoralis]|uniref:Uncharacterized protein n=1 Tax=Pelagibius litoralis TaxID=374515 RepID=A0A967KB40_9PROT|nr:hypothetical protein [Pelagibius litoralis]NIA71983.1 hypothetical protein [Pelagibius litoralis]
MKQMRHRGKNWPAVLALLLSTAALAACQTANTARPQTGANGAVPSKAAVIEPQSAAAAEVAPAEAPGQIAAVPPQPVAIEPSINDDPNQLMGLDRSGLTALLGRPDLVRREKPAEIWQYVTADCVFDVVLYDSGPQYRVTYLEARNAAADRLAPRPCLNQVLRSRLNAPIS